MKALLGMAKERRKEEEFKPMAKLNLQQRQQQQEQDEQYEEQFDQQYQHDEQQILGYADYIGIRLPEEEQLLYIAKEGLMASLPPDWEERQQDDGDIIYVNRKTGEALAEHPCDEYYRQLVIKQRKKKGGSNISNKFTGIQPVGIGLNQQSKLSAPQQQPKKDIDPLVKMQMEKKKKKLQEQKKKQYDQKKKQIKQKYEKKKQQFEAQLKGKQKKLKDKCEQQLDNQRNKMKKKMSEDEKLQQEKNKKEIEKYERETRAKLQKRYYDKRVIEKQKIQKNMKAKRQQIRIALQNAAKVKKKQIQEQHRQKIKLLGEKQRQINNQKSQGQILNELIAQLKQQIIQKRIKEYSKKIQQEKQRQQLQFRAKIAEIEKANEDIIKNIETSAPKNQLKFDTLAHQVQQSQKQELQVLQYELSMMKQVKKAQKQEKLQNFKRTFQSEKKDDIERLQRQNENLLQKLRRLKQDQYLSKIAESEKKIKQSYLNSLKQIKQKFDQQQQIIELEGQATRRDESGERQSLQMMNQLAQKLRWKEQALRGEIQAIRQQISKLSKNTKPIKHRLTDEQLRMYNLIKQKLQQPSPQLLL